MISTVLLRTAKKGGHDWGSRDYNDPVRCQVSYCPCNNGKGFCTLPSQIDIGTDGRCKKAKDFKDE